MDTYKEYLAVQVLNESQIVSHRQLSRALKVHNQLAKQMLYDFHKSQNAKKPNSVHATYLLTGTARTEPTESAKNTQTQDYEDSIMQSSPFPSSYPEPEPPLEFEDEDVEPVEENIPMTIVTLVREEDLEEAKEEFDEITNICLYSIQPGTPQDINILTESSREVLNQLSTEDPLEVYKQYGIIQNPNVKRRTGRKPPILAAPAAAATKPSVKTQTKAPAPLSANNRQNSATSQKSAASDNKSTPASLKREKSDIFKSFAKTKPPKPKEAAPVDDEPMKGMSEDEEEEEDFVMVEGTKESGEKAAAAKAERAERQKRLRDMMDDDDEPMVDTSPVEEEEEEEEEEEVDAGSPIDKPAVEEPKETATVVGGRRRGRRRVMKKKTMKDEEGYLVTKEEAVWESFSEEEPQAKKAKTFAPSNAKGKKPAGKPGQGNIMSFFSKK